MEDTMTLSTSASSVRTLHRSLAELASQREQQNECVHCSGTTLMSTTSIVQNNGTIAGSSTHNPHGSALTESQSSYPSSSYGHLSSTMSASTSALVLPSPPDSPNLSPIHSGNRSPFLDSVSESSLPSVSSSFFFSSSAAGSPGRSRGGSYPGSYPHSEHGSQPHLPEHEHEHGHGHGHDRTAGHNLIIPSLTLPSALRRPTPFGQTLGELRLLVLGAQGAGKSFLTGLLLEDNEDVVEVGTWEDWDEGANVGTGLVAGPDVDGTYNYGYGKVLRASTDYAEQKDAFGLERYEPTRNVHIVELPGYSQDADVTELITRLKHIIETPFRSVNDVLNRDTAPSGVVASLLASPTSPLYTAMVFLLPSRPTTLDRQIISALSMYIPLIVLPRLNGPQREPASAKLSAFRPASAVSLRNGLFHSPETVALLRSEAADRFLRWREVERSVNKILGGAGGERTPSDLRWDATLRMRRLGEKEWGRFAAGVRAERDDVQVKDGGVAAAAMKGWSKAKWEAEWMDRHSEDVDVARRSRAREGTITEANRRRQDVAKAERKDDAAEPEDQNEKEESDDDEIYEKESQQGDVDTTFQDPTADLPRSRIDPSCTLGGSAVFDPLHLPSLIIFSVSLLGPLKARVGESVRLVVTALGDTRVRIALISGISAGVAVGLLVR